MQCAYAQAAWPALLDITDVTQLHLRIQPQKAKPLHQSIALRMSGQRLLTKALARHTTGTRKLVRSRLSFVGSLAIATMIGTLAFCYDITRLDIS
jgi:hypothetical protein